LALSDSTVPLRPDREPTPSDLKGNVRLRSSLTDSVSDLFRALDLRSNGPEETRGAHLRTSMANSPAGLVNNGEVAAVAPGGDGVFDDLQKTAANSKA
jgi:hypothetical protein